MKSSRTLRKLGPSEDSTSWVMVDKCVLNAREFCDAEHSHRVRRQSSFEFLIDSPLAQNGMMGRRKSGAGGVGRLGVGRFEYLPTAREVW
jgi:hypothetical protein